MRNICKNDKEYPTPTKKWDAIQKQMKNALEDKKSHSSRSKNVQKLYSDIFACEEALKDSLTKGVWEVTLEQFSSMRDTEIAQLLLMKLNGVQYTGVNLPSRQRYNN